MKAVRSSYRRTKRNRVHAVEEGNGYTLCGRPARFQMPGEFFSTARDACRTCVNVLLSPKAAP